MRTLPALCLLLASIASHAATPQQISQIYANEAAAREAGLKAAALHSNLPEEERRRASSLHYGASPAAEESAPGEVPRLSRAGEFPPIEEQVAADLAAAFQEAVVDVLVRKTAEAASVNNRLACAP